MWLWIVVAMATAVHAAVISDDENRRIKDIKAEVLGKYTKMR